MGEDVVFKADPAFRSRVLHHAPGQAVMEDEACTKTWWVLLLDRANAIPLPQRNLIFLSVACVLSPCYRAEV